MKDESSGTRGTYAHIIGNGGDNSHRSNAFTVSWTGNVWCSGDVTDGSGNVLSEKSEVSVAATGTSTTEAKYITVDGVEYKLGGGGGLPIGAIFYYPLSTAPAGSYLLNGQTITNCQTLYPDFWDWLGDAVTAGMVRTLTNAQYEAEITTYGQCGAFVISGSNVRLPLINGFIQGLGNGTDKGATVAPGLPNISGSVSIAGPWSSANGNGSLYSTDKWDNFVAGQYGQTMIDALYFDASRSSSIYKNNFNTVQPPAIKYSYCIQVFNTATELSQQESAQIATSLQGKADKGFGNIDSNIDVVKCYHIESDGSWVRIWKSGWVEQGGQLANGTYSPVQVNLAVIFQNTLYTVLMSCRGGAASYTAGNPAADIVSASCIKISTNAGDFLNSFWYACGQGNPTSINDYIASL